MKQKRVTIRDIASRLGCSPSTVSRALNDKPSVSEVVRAEIRILALEMGYDLKHIQRKKIEKLSPDVQNISIIVTEENFLDEIFFRQVIREIEQSFFKKKINVSFSIVNSSNSNIILSSLRRSKPDGVIVFGMVSRQNMVDVICSGFPTVLVDVFNINIKVDRVVANNYLGSYEATNYLIQEGHIRIGFLGDPRFSHNMLERYNGCHDAVSQLGGIWIDMDRISSLDMHNSIFIDKKKLQDVICSEKPPTAILCGNDRIALLLYQCLEQLGLSVPDDISIIGFDNAACCEEVSPPLTSVHVPKFELAQETVRLLLDRIADPKRVTTFLQLDASLVVRESVKKLTPEEKH